MVEPTTGTGTGIAGAAPVVVPVLAGTAFWVGTTTGGMSGKIFEGICPAAVKE